MRYVANYCSDYSDDSFKGLFENTNDDGDKDMYYYMNTISDSQQFYLQQNTPR